MPLEIPPSQANNHIHTLIAGTILLIFWGMIGVSFKADLLPPTLWVWQQLSGESGNVVGSRFFLVNNNAGVSYSKVNSVTSVLETDYRTILRYLNQELGEPLPVLITRGFGPPLVMGKQLILFFDGYNINLDTAPFFLVMLTQDASLDSDNLFLEGGYAIYISEEIDRAKGLGQDSDAWVLLLHQREALLPFEQAWQISPPSGRDEAFGFGRALLQGGSFIRWVAETYGQEAVTALRQGERLETVTGLYFDEAEKQWLAAVQAKDITVYPCQTATRGKMWLQPFCERLSP